MTAQAALGGFKILKDVARISLVVRGRTFPEALFRKVAEQKINLPYATLVSEGDFWGLNLVVEAADEETICRLIQESYGKIFTLAPRSAVLSVFPHRRNPQRALRRVYPRQMRNRQGPGLRLAVDHQPPQGIGQAR